MSIAPITACVNSASVSTVLFENILCNESEKTACIASFFYPQFDWLATGGNNKLTSEKIHVLFNRKIYYLNDADKAGKENSTLKRLKEYQQDFQIINLFPDRSDGYDLADAIIDGLRPEIKPPVQETTVKKIKEAKVSLFAQVEKHLNDLYDIRYNEISNEIEYKSKEEADYKPLNENTILYKPVTLTPTRRCKLTP